MGQFVLKVRDLEEGSSDRRFEIPDQWLEGQLADVEEIDGAGQGGLIELALTRQGREVLLRGTIRTTLKVTCVRCLEEFQFSVDASLDVLMLPDRPDLRRPRDDEDEDDESADELGVERYRGDEVVLDGLVRDTILLEVPMNPNCGEACQGWDHLRGDGGS